MQEDFHSEKMGCKYRDGSQYFCDSKGTIMKRRTWKHPSTTPNTRFPDADYDIGKPGIAGPSLLGINGVAGGTDYFHVQGVHYEKEGDMVYPTYPHASLEYSARYDMELFEYGARITVNETYYLSAANLYTDIENAGAVLSVVTSDKTIHRVPLGELVVMGGPDRSRLTSINIHGTHPEKMLIEIYITLAETSVFSNPLTPYQFNANPFDFYDAK